MVIPPFEQEPNDLQDTENTPNVLQEDLEAIAGTTENPSVPTIPVISGGDIPSKQEDTRSWLAKGLLIILGVSVGLIAVYVSLVLINKDSKDNENIKNSKDLIILLWTSEVTLVSGSLGFYFGSKGN